MPPRRVFTQEELEYVRKCRTNYATPIYVLAERLKVSTPVLGRAMKEAGVSTRYMRRPKRGSRLTRDRVEGLLKQGKTHREIAAMLCVKPAQVKQFCAHRHITRYDTDLTIVSELAVELGLSGDTLQRLIKAGKFEAVRFGPLWALTPEQEKAVRAFYDRPSEEEYAHYLTSKEAAAILGMTSSRLHQLVREGLTPFQAVSVRAKRGLKFKFPPDGVRAFAAQRQQQRQGGKKHGNV